SIVRAARISYSCHCIATVSYRSTALRCISCVTRRVVSRRSASPLVAFTTSDSRESGCTTWRTSARIPALILQEPWMRRMTWSRVLALSPATMWSQTQPKRLATVDSLNGPEALSYDAAVDAYFVSNMGNRDGHGFVTRIRGRDGVVDSLHFIKGL